MNRIWSWLVPPTGGQGGGLGCVIVLFVSGIGVLSVVAALLPGSPA